VFVRVARFEGAEPSGIAAEIGRVKEGIAAAQDGEWGDLPEGLKRIARHVTLVDAARGTVLDLNFCETESDLHAVDEALNGMAPLADSSGRRVSVETFEVAIDATML
jgi:hypothetical protein